MEVWGKIDDELVKLKLYALINGELKELDVQLKNEKAEGEPDV